MKQKEQGLGAMSLPSRNYVNHKVNAVMREGVEFTPTQVWHDLTSVVQSVLTSAYGDEAKAKRAVQRCIQNMNQLHGNPTKIRGRGVGAVFVYNYETDKGKRKDIVFTTETLDPLDNFDDGRAQESGVGGSESVREPFVSKAEAVASIREAGYREGRIGERTSSDPIIEATGASQLVVEKDGKLEPVTFSPVEVPVSQVGDQTTYTLVGLFLDGTFLWREESTGHVGSIEFTAL